MSATRARTRLPWSPWNTTSSPTSARSPGSTKLCLVGIAVSLVQGLIDLDIVVSAQTRFLMGKGDDGSMDFVVEALMR